MKSITVIHHALPLLRNKKVNFFLKKGSCKKKNEWLCQRTRSYTTASSKERRRRGKPFILSGTWVGSAALYFLPLLIFCVCFKYFIFPTKQHSLVLKKVWFPRIFPRKNVEICIWSWRFYIEVSEQHNTSKYAPTFAFAIYAYDIHEELCFGTISIKLFLTSKGWQWQLTRRHITSNYYCTLYEWRPKPAQRQCCHDD